MVLFFFAIEYNNDNIFYFSLIVLTLISCIPSFERERFEEIKLNPFDSKKYLMRQFKSSIINTFYLVVPILIIICILFKWEVLYFSILIFIIPLLNIVLKYAYFNNYLLHQIIFTFFIGLSILLYGTPLLIIPLLYKKAIKNLNTIKYANH